MPAWRSRAVWAGVAILCYLVAAATFLVVVIGAGLIGGGSGLGALTAADFAMLFVSVGLFVAGGYAMHRVRRSARPERSPLPPQFRQGSGPSSPNLDATTDPFGEAAGDDEVRCPNCDTVNDAEYRFCENCSSELPG